MPKYLMPDSVQSVEDVKRGFAHLTERMEDLEKRAGPGGISPDDMAAVRTQLEAVIASQAAMDEKLKAAAWHAPSDEFLRQRVAGLAMRYKPDKDFAHISREQWNLINYTPRELSFAADSERYHRGLGDRLANRFRHNEGDAFDDLIERIQHLNDQLMTLDAVLSTTESYMHSGTTRLERMRKLETWKEWERALEQLQRSGLATGQTNIGAEWVPTFYSAQLHGLVQLDLGVANLFDSVDMPGPTYYFPVLKQDGDAYYVAEVQSGAAGTDIVNTAQVAIPESNAQTTNMYLQAWKIASRMWATSEATEDLVVPAIPFILGQLAKVLARADDNIVLNADNTPTGSGGHLDVGRTNAPAGPQNTNYTHQLKCACKGVRVQAIRNTWAGGAAVYDFSAYSYLTILTARAALGAMGQRPRDLPLIVNMNGLMKLYQMKDPASSTISMLMTVDKYGPGALVHTGEVGNVGGHPIILSEFCYDDTDGTTGARTNAGTKTQAIMPYVPAFLRGIRRGTTITRSDQRYIEYDQLVFVATARRDFKPWYGTTTRQAVVFGNM